MDILLLEDDKVLAKEIITFLSNKHIICEHSSNGIEFLKLTQSRSFQILLLDVNVPGLNGMDVCREIRISDKHTPILMLTALGELDDKIKSFEIGADDYLVKPFHLEELYVRIMALSRRSKFEAEDIIKIEDLEINLNTKTVNRAGQHIQLTNKEFTLLHILIEANGRVLSKKEIAYKLWDDHFETSFNTIEVYINFLRRKIDKKYDEKLIHTKMGFGYYIGKIINDN
jgi:DNA-binding response OmpR family regulator